MYASLKAASRQALNTEGPDTTMVANEGKGLEFLKANAGKHRLQYTPRSNCFADMFAAKKVMETFGEPRSW